MNLYSLLSVHALRTPLIYSPSGTWSVERVITGINYNRDNIQGKRLAIRVTDTGKALEILTALDGVAESIVFIAPSMPISEISRILILAKCDAIITDDAPLLNEQGITNAYSNIDTIPKCTDEIRKNSIQTAWILPTSGTSGEPKLVSHSLSSLIRTTKIDPLKGSQVCWGLLYEYSRFAGLQVLLQSVLSGSKLIAPAIDSPLEEKIHLFTEKNCTHLSATPTMWRKIAMTPDAEYLPLKQISLGGEIADVKLLSTLSTLYPLARITHIYASTEAGVGFSVNDCQAGFPESFLTNPPSGIDLRIIDSRLQVKNSNVKSTYIGTDLSFGTVDGWIDTGDNVEIKNGRVFFLGRNSGLINVGGNKVHPEEVEKVLLMHPKVAFVRVFGKSSPIMGSLIAAEIILNTIEKNPAQIRIEIQSFAASMLDRHKVPAIINIVTDIECNSIGKVFRGQNE